MNYKIDSIQYVLIFDSVLYEIKNTFKNVFGSFVKGKFIRIYNIWFLSSKYCKEINKVSKWYMLMISNSFNFDQ